MSTVCFDFHFNSFDSDSIESWMETTRRRVRALMVSRIGTENAVFGATVRCPWSVCRGG